MATSSTLSHKRELSTSITSTPIRSNLSNKFRPDLNKEIGEDIGMDFDSSDSDLEADISIKDIIKSSLTKVMEDHDLGPNTRAPSVNQATPNKSSKNKSGKQQEQQQGVEVSTNNELMIMMQKFMCVMIDGVATAVDAAVNKVLKGSPLYEK